MTSETLSKNIAAVYRRISHAAMRAGRDPGDVRLVAVTKTVDIERLKEAIDLGLRIFGESYVQEAQKKVSGLRPQVKRIEWHLVGHLQRNKAKMAVELFDLIHSLDSIALAEELNKQAEKINKVQEVLIQVKLSEEGTKHGIPRENLMNLIKVVSEMKNLKLEGLMTMPPFFDDPEMARPYFRGLRELRDNINELRVTRYELRDLSMGMSNDFEVAIEEGATMVRIGTAIFGERKASP